ncbi:MAG: hypothetical protein J6M93_03510 [Succinivibrio sp.]|nr:hypothetical protein [Succinivibrio sp.]
MAFTFNRNLLIGLGAGIVAGVLGAKYYNEHKDEIDSKLKGMGLQPKKNAPQNVADDTEMTLEELETQKERLEDLIADFKNKQSRK